MKIISWNVNGIRAIAKKDFFETVGKMAPDILCLQETKAQDHEVEETLSTLEHYNINYNSADKKGYSGTAILGKIAPIAISNDMNITEHDTEGRIQCAEYDDFFLVNVYVPNSGQQLDRLDYRKQWDADFLNYLKNLEKTKSVIACGDFNVAHRPIDLKNDKSNYNKTAGYTQIEIDGMDNFIKSGFVDSFRHFHPDVVAYTYWSYRFKSRERNTGWRIDYFLVSKSLVECIKSVEILSDYFGSDHCPIALELEL
ncbi:exodeoxyribonuclease III [Arenibacter sp. BSSL-BM3]|uniref:Exodeoxyribonuclease III n=1 Tax=Arenibacter arenosicollis TaxID=2762274 RepID=A0ABR7QN67_9FLAO|nr:exodeoxyribonuclease III [Arenibacter arenosicollis]MBC8768633.1 exodeoxyribonuclease III [Arenibacter arenosicollis]